MGANWSPRDGSHRHGGRAHVGYPDVHAIILAAGRGSRMKQATAIKPKCLVEVGGRPLLEHQFDILRRHAIQNILVVAGYKAGEVEAAVAGRSKVIRNDIWDKTNSLYSLSLCRPYVRGPILVLNCDVLAHPMMLRRVLDIPGSAFAYDSVTGTDEEHMKVALRQGRLIAMSKDLDPRRSRGENVGLLSFDAPTAQALFREVDTVLAEDGHGMWLAAGVQRVAQYMPISAVDIADLPWVEIDYPEDLVHAQELVWPRFSQWPAAPELLAS